jgi:hypothetical protein
VRCCQTKFTFHSQLSSTARHAGVCAWLWPGWPCGVVGCGPFLATPLAYDPRSLPFGGADGMRVRWRCQCPLTTSMLLHSYSLLLPSRRYTRLLSPGTSPTEVTAPTSVTNSAYAGQGGSPQRPPSNVRAHAGAAGGATGGAYSDERVTVPAVEAEVQVTAGRWWHLHDLDGFFRHAYHHYDAKGLCVHIAVIPIHLISITTTTRKDCACTSQLSLSISYQSPLRRERTVRAHRSYPQPSHINQLRIKHSHEREDAQSSFILRLLFSQFRQAVFVIVFFLFFLLLLIFLNRIFSLARL